MQVWGYLFEHRSVTFLLLAPIPCGMFLLRNIRGFGGILTNSKIHIGAML